MNRRNETTRHEWVTVASYLQPIEAHLARTKLESEGIPCVVGDENLVSMHAFLSNAVGGVKVKVPDQLLEQARDALRPRPHLVVAADDDDVVEGDPICPRCRSGDVYCQRYNRPLAGVFILLLGFLVPWRDRRATCKQCGYEWKER